MRLDECFLTNKGLHGVNLHPLSDVVVDVVFKGTSIPVDVAMTAQLKLEEGDMLTMSVMTDGETVPDVVSLPYEKAKETGIFVCMNRFLGLDLNGWLGLFVLRPFEVAGLFGDVE